jgi:hypothetical protein
MKNKIIFFVIGFAATLTSAIRKMKFSRKKTEIDLKFQKIKKLQ